MPQLTSDHCELSSGRLRWVVVIVACAALLATPGFARAKVREETIRFAGPSPALSLALRHAELPQNSKPLARPVLLILHGAGVPVSGNPDYPQGGISMMAALAELGIDVWALDFYGFGDSDRYPEMSELPETHPPLGRADECAEQVSAAVTFLRHRLNVDQFMLLGDSGGSVVAGVFAERHPESVSRLVLFGPMTPFTQGPAAAASLPAYVLLTPEELWSTFSGWADVAGLPAVLNQAEYPAWAQSYLRSDPTSVTRSPPSVAVPNGRQADARAIAAGHFPYNPAAIRAPTLIVMGEWDQIATFAGAEWLLHALRQAPERQLVVIGHASHTIQYETERRQLYRAIGQFLSGR